MKHSRLGSMIRRKSSNPHYQTFPTKPPTSRGRPPANNQNSQNHNASSRNESGDSHHQVSPLPVRQLAILAVIALCEQTALNSISPYLPDMASTFPEVGEGQVGLYVGIIASAFALAQFTTNFFWGWLSDMIGRKPVILLGTLFTAGCFIAFGFCRTLWQAILVQTLMGLLNGNQGVVSTCLGEITDRSNQSKAFVYLPVIYGIGGITGPLIGGLLVTERNPFDSSKPSAFPYLPPNMLSAALLIVDLILTMIFLEESLEEARDLPPLGKRIEVLFSWFWQFTSSTRPSYLHSPPLRPNTGDGAIDSSDEVEEDEDDDGDGQSILSMPALFPHHHSEQLDKKQILNRDTILLLVTYLIFQLCGVAFNSLYPIFAQAKPPTGRSLSPSEIGSSLAFAGVVTIIFQVGVFGKLREQMGNRITYRASFALFAVSFLLMPWIGYKDYDGWGIGRGKVILWIELGIILLVKTVAAVSGLTSALLLITNSAPNHAVLGALNGLAQTLSAGGRAVGPFLSGGLFSLAMRVRPKGEAVAWGLFGGVSFLGLLLSFGIRGQNLEAEGFGEEEGDEETVDEADEHSQGERNRLLP